MNFTYGDQVIRVGGYLWRHTEWVGIIEEINPHEDLYYVQWVHPLFMCTWAWQPANSIVSDVCEVPL